MRHAACPAATRPPARAARAETASPPAAAAAQRWAATLTGSPSAVTSRRPYGPGTCPSHTRPVCTATPTGGRGAPSAAPPIRRPGHLPQPPPPRVHRDAARRTRAAVRVTLDRAEEGVGGLDGTPGV